MQNSGNGTPFFLMEGSTRETANYGLANIRQPMETQNATNLVVNDNNHLEQGIKGLWNKNCLSDLFFSAKNIKAVQQGIRIMVAENTGGKHIIEDLDEKHLIPVMREIYNTYSRNMPTFIVEQTRDLNKKVLDKCVHLVLVEIEQYENYIKDISRPYQPIDHPTNLSNKGSRLLYRDQLF